MGAIYHVPTVHPRENARKSSKAARKPPFSRPLTRSQHKNLAVAVGGHVTTKHSVECSGEEGSGGECDIEHGEIGRANQGSGLGSLGGGGGRVVGKRALERLNWAPLVLQAGLG